MLDRFCDLLKDRQGAAALLFSIALPAVLIVGAASMEYGALAKRRAELQKAADAAALAATAQLGVAGATDSRIEAVAKAIVLASAGAREPQAKVAGAVLNNRTLDRGDRRQPRRQGPVGAVLDGAGPGDGPARRKEPALHAVARCEERRLASSA